MNQFDEGWVAGYEDGRTYGELKTLTTLAREFEKDDVWVIEKLQEIRLMTQEQAAEALREYKDTLHRPLLSGAEEDGDRSSLDADRCGLVWNFLIRQAPQLLVPLVNAVYEKQYPDDALVEFGDAALPPEKKGATVAPEINNVLFAVSSQPSEAPQRYFIALHSGTPEDLSLGVVTKAVLLAQQPDTGTYSAVAPDRMLLVHGSMGRGEEARVYLHWPLAPWGASKQDLPYASVISVADYPLQEIIGERLYILMPFYILRYEDKLDELDADKQKRTPMLLEFCALVGALKDAVTAGKVSAHDRAVLLSCTADVVAEAAYFHDKVREDILGVIAAAAADR